MKLMDTNQTSTKSGLDLNSSPLFSYPDDAITAVIKSDNLGSGHGDGLSVVLDMFCRKRDVAAMLLFFSIWFYKTPSTFLLRWFLIRRRRTMFGFFETKKATKPPWCFSHWYWYVVERCKNRIRKSEWEEWEGKRVRWLRRWGALFGLEWVKWGEERVSCFWMSRQINFINTLSNHL